MKTRYYILKGKIAVQVDGVLEWAKWYEESNKIVKQSYFGDIKVSTVFLGLDHSFSGGEPILFETMIFGGEHDEDQWRYSTWDEAEIGHKKACDLAINVENKQTHS